MKGGREAQAEPGGAQHLVPAERSTMRKATHRARPAMPRAPEAAFRSADKRVGKIDLEDSVVSKKTGSPCQEDLFELSTLYVTRPTSNNVAPKELSMQNCHLQAMIYHRPNQLLLPLEGGGFFRFFSHLF